MLDNDKLNKRLKKIFKELKEKWGIKPYRIAVETGIPHSSLKYMVDGKFEWKLNHLLSVIDFLNRFGAKISLTELLDFEENKPLSKIINTEKADFRIALCRIKRGRRKLSDIQVGKSKKTIVEEKAVDFKREAELLTQEIVETINESRLSKNSKILVGLKVDGKDSNFHKNLSFVNGKQRKK
jgi:hypothetical protein